jgi:hypothetical protein
MMKFAQLVGHHVAHFHASIEDEGIVNINSHYSNFLSLSVDKYLPELLRKNTAGNNNPTINMNGALVNPKEAAIPSWVITPPFI